MRYYLTQRPPAPGTFPGKPSVIVGYDAREYVEDIERNAWGYVEYDEELTRKQASDYELVAENTLTIEMMQGMIPEYRRGEE